MFFCDKQALSAGYGGYMVKISRKSRNNGVKIWYKLITLMENPPKLFLCT
jgi:hypothetical protein